MELHCFEKLHLLVFFILLNWSSFGLHCNILVALEQIIVQLAVTLPLKISLFEAQSFVGSFIGFRRMYFTDTATDQCFNHINYNHSLFALCFQNSWSFSSKIIGKEEVCCCIILWNFPGFNWPAIAKCLSKA